MKALVVVEIRVRWRTACALLQELGAEIGPVAEWGQGRGRRQDQGDPITHVTVWDCLPHAGEP